LQDSETAATDSDSNCLRHQLQLESCKVTRMVKLIGAGKSGPKIVLSNALRY